MNSTDAASGSDLQAAPKTKTGGNVYLKGIVCLMWVFVIFGAIAYKMGVAPMMKTMMATAHDLLLNTCFFLMAVCVLTGALGRILVE
ncbi:MAG: hypothetical protein K2J34_02035, partial [Muribaculaceae bacterium]|nr:hypothetical protein [Muribaculaceae bacterium]